MKADEVYQTKHKGSRMCKVQRDRPAKKENDLILKCYICITYFKDQAV